MNASRRLTFGDIYVDLHVSAEAGDSATPDVLESGTYLSMDLGGTWVITSNYPPRKPWKGRGAGPLGFPST